LLGAANLGLLAGFDINADGFCMPLHGFGGDLDTGQKFQLLPALVEARLAADHSYHSAHAGRTEDAFHIQFPVTRTLAFTAMPADVVTALEPHRTKGGEQLLGSRIVIVRRLAAGARSLSRLPRIL
jgi:hypothetical protein